MNQQGFEDYTYFAYGRETGAANSYIRAIQILDNIFAQKDVFQLQGKSLTEIDDEYLLNRITEFVASEEKKFRTNGESIFQYGPRKATHVVASAQLRCVTSKDTRRLNLRRLLPILLLTD